MYQLDPTWLPFSNLMLQHIYNVLLICSDYDRFLLEEDGRVEEELYLEYTQLGLSNPPKITHTSDPAEALSLLKERKFELVITMIDLLDEPVERLCADIKAIDPAMPVVVLSPSPTHRRNKYVKSLGTDNIDSFFYWQGNPSIFLAMVKLVEDRMNLEHDTSVADVQVIILVEDSVRFYSSYLPLMYTCLIQENSSTILEALNTWGKHLRMRGRPKILLARTYEEASSLFNRYLRNILGVISDIAFSRGGVQDQNAGLELTREIHKKMPETPVLLQSADAQREQEADDLGAAFIWKQSPTLLADLNTYMNRHYGFGPFIFREPESGMEIARASTMRELQKILPTIPPDSFAYHSRRNDFSRWLRAQGLFQLASRVKEINIDTHNDAQATQKRITETIRSYRTERAKGVISLFSRDTYDETLFFSRIGSGSLGGKGRGLAFIDKELRASGLMAKYPDVYLSIPRTVVISTDQFARFIQTNHLEEVVSQDLSDDELLHLFLSYPVQDDLLRDLGAILSVIHNPISVRSSSLLEDSHFQPFAGVYETCMLPNNGDDAQRLEELADAVRCVWASTYTRRAKAYMQATEHMVEEEKMAVIIQQVIGSRHGAYWYPNISGVARSLNYYPLNGEKTTDGVGMISFGFGKAIVDNGSAFRFSPVHPKRPAQFLGGTNTSTQSTFYALPDRPYRPLEHNAENLELLDISHAEQFPESLKYIASTYDQASGTLTESIRAEGQKIITFNGILKYDAFPLASIVRDVLELGTRAMSTPVEIEFAVNLNRKSPKLPEFSLLQIRPIAEGNEQSDITITPEEREESVVWSPMVMGNGNIQGIQDVITIKPEAFRQNEMPAMADELDGLNAVLAAKGREYLLIVVGRLGSCDPWLGIPVSWSQISGSRVIVETGLKDFQVEPSQGTHFFQNMTSLGCVYMTVNPAFGEGTLHLERLSPCSLEAETAHFRHYHTPAPLSIKVNGHDGEGVVCIQEKAQS
ncbi:MAG: pyruvate, phosphate dikinase [Sphaerochaeta sp.]|jgi:DNA-binding NarL/FixJ family response regulator|nr:pyruvate, phosphate dikinase [Sphaerochaeta sp.]MCH3919523.1 pyruvate, phosphate dikinase [Sphaerochaeta sp.]MCI2045886.1 pyruvate, phosphate dikinase [Sphaerochaeta sp.]MCI2097579.1 pyruvate, phosphate dikinase [Sphaerochaeta sp.]MCI2104493.1 pyruvate, phosphate dikinase [Sphaerochaeta sp.]